MTWARPEQMLLEAITEAVRGSCVRWEAPIEEKDWALFFRLAQQQKLLPAVCQAVYACPAAAQSGSFAACRKQAILQAAEQAVKTDAFLSLYGRMEDAGFHPLVVKGLVCRSLWPQSDTRISGDEDLLIPENEFSACCDWLKQNGMFSAAQSPDAFEIGWHSTEGPLTVELHRALFPPDSDALSRMNVFFADARARAYRFPVEGGAEILTLCPHDHLLYLLLHACKHFIHSGFGIRQVCDIGLFAARYASNIDWHRLSLQCADVQAFSFAVSVFRIAREVLGISWALPAEWTVPEVDCVPMLQDLLAGGIYGTADKTRQHTASVTLHAVEAQYSGACGGLRSTLFPPRAKLTGRYPVLRSHPVLLPFCWVHRLACYGAETLRTDSDSAADSLRLAELRKKLLRQYGILS